MSMSILPPKDPRGQIIDDLDPEQLEQESMIDSVEWASPDELRNALETKPMNKQRGTLELSLIEQLRTRANAKTRARCARLLRQGAAYLVGLADELAAPPAASAPRKFNASEQRWLDRKAAEKQQRRGEKQQRRGKRPIMRE
jgi:hypothetical protein